MTFHEKLRELMEKADMNKVNWVYHQEMLADFLANHAEAIAELVENCNALEVNLPMSLDGMHSAKKWRASLAKLNKEIA